MTGLASRVGRPWASRATRLFGFYALLAFLSFPVLEMAFLGVDAPQRAHDLFDDGSVSRLGFAAADWREHGLTLWNPYLTGGNASLAQFTGSPFAIDTLMCLLVGPFAAFALTTFLIAFVAGASMHLFLRDSVKVGPAACAAGAVFYTFSFWHYNVGFVYPALPLLLWLSDRAIQAGAHAWKYLVATVGLAAFMFYNFQSQGALLVAGAHLAYLMATAGSGSERWQRARMWGTVWILALLFYGPVLTTQLALLPESQRSLRNDEAFYPSALAKLRELVRFYSGVLFVVPLGGGIGGPPIYYGTFYLGVVGLPLFAVSLISKRSTRQSRLLLMAIPTILIVDAIALLVLLPMQEHLGVFRSFQFVRVRHFVPFVLSANVAWGVAALARRPAREGQPIWRWGIGSLAAGCLLLQAVASARSVAWLVRSQGMAAFTAGLGSPRETGWFLALVYCVATAAVWFAIAHWRRQRSLEPSARAWAGRQGLLSFETLLVLTLVGERWVVARVERYLEPDRIASFASALGESPGLRYLKNHPNPQVYRVLTLGPYPARRFRNHPDRLMFHRLYAADGYENICPQRYHELFGRLTAPYLLRHPEWARYYYAWGDRVWAFGPDLNRSLADLMGIRWLYTWQEELHEPDLVEVFAEGDERIYENRAVLPRAFVASDLVLFATRPQLLDALSNASAAELRRHAYALHSEVPTPTLDTAAPAGGGTAEFTHYGPDRVTVAVTAQARGVLVLTDVYVPGWVVLVNGRPATLFPVDNAFRGVALPPGRSEVRFEYRPGYTARGVLLALVAAVVTAAWALYLRRASRSVLQEG